MQKDFRGDGVRDKGKGSGGGGHQAYVSPGEREQQAEEGRSHACDREEKVWIAERARNHPGEADAAAQLADVPDLFHGVRQKHVADHRGEDDGEDRAPGIKVPHDSTPLATAAARGFSTIFFSASFFSASLFSASLAASPRGCSVSAGPPATNPTPAVINTIPIQR